MDRIVRIALLLSIIIFPFISEGQLTAHFTADQKSGCAPLIVHFSDSSTGSPVRWHWVFDNLLPADTANIQNPLWVYTTPGHYSVKLVVYDASGHSDSLTITNEIFIASQPVVRFTSSDTILSCPPQTITFTNTSDTGGCSPVYTWFIDTSSSIHSKNATYTFTHSGNYDITLQESDACGCNGYLTKTAYVKIDTAPVVCFTANDTVICSPPATVCYSNCTSGGIHYLWHFGDGGSDTIFAPCHTYTVPGNFTNTLTVTAGNACATSLVKTAYIQVSDFAPAFYTVPSAPTCVNTALTFHDTTSGTGAFHHWHFSTGVADTSSAVSPTHTYTATGSFTVTDSAWNSSGCHGVTTGIVVVKARPVVSFTATNAYRCTPNDTVSFTSTVTDAAGIASRIWHFGDAGSGIYNIAYSDSIHIYTATGFYTPVLTVIDSNGCFTKDSVINEINIHAPVGTISVVKDSGCIPFPLTYSTTVTPTGTPYITDSVTFGDGGVMYTSSGIHTYTVSGIYEVHHYYHLATGCAYSDSIKVLAGTHSTYAAVVTPDSVCQNTTVTFKGNCTTCTHESWNIVTTTSTADSLVGSYTTPGIKTIIYIANTGGCADTLKDTVFVYPPTAIFSATVPGCGDRYTYTFVNTSSKAIDFHWDFGDGDTSALTSPSHTYATDGTYTVVLTDVDSTGHGCTNSDTVVIHIAPFAVAFTVNDTIACKTQSLTFTGPLTATGAKYSQYIWKFGDGGTSASTTTNIATHAYSAVGTYTVTLVIKNTAGCFDTVVQANYVKVVVPAGGVTPTSIVGCAPLTVSFHDADTAYSGGAIVRRRWIWNVGGASFRGYGTDTSHLYTEGVYSAVLIDSDNIGCFVRDTIQIRAVKPHAYFYSADTAACADVQISFADTNTNVSYTWYFGDGTGAFPTTGPDVAHMYTVNGVYSDTLVIVTNSTLGGYPVGCSDTMVKTNYVHISSSSIDVGFSLNDTFTSCPPLIIHAIPVNDGNYYQWKFGLDSSTVNSTSNSPVFVYNYPGVYDITLIDSNALGCKDSLKKKVTVLGPTGIVSITPDSGCIPLAVSLHVTYTGSGILDTPFTWSLPPYGVYNTDTPGIAQIYTEGGNWNPFVIIQSGGCHVTVHTADSIRVFPPEITVNQPSIKCKYAVDTLEVHGLVDSFTWSPAYGLSCTSCPSTFASPTVTTTYTVTGINGHHCSNTAVTTVFVDAPPVIDISGRDHICIGLCDTLAASGVGGPYSWLFPSGGVSCATCDTIATCPLVTQLYTFVGVDSNSCNDSAAFTITVDSLPVIVVTPLVSSACIGAPATITAGGAVFYSWSPVASLSCATCAVTSAAPSVTTVFSVTGTDGNGCKDTASALVNIDQLPLPGAISGSVTLCVGVSDVLTDTVAGGIWSATNTAAATVNATGVVTGIAAGIDTIKYTLTNSCGNAHATALLTVFADPVSDITTHSLSSLCANTLYQNFGTSVVPPAGVSYTWSADNASVYAIGSGQQYCLVSFPDSGKSYVVLTAELAGVGCTSADTFAVTVGADVSASPQVIFYAPDELVCMDNTADSYQWGYDDRETLDSFSISGALNQDYFIAAPDFANKYYWVITTHNGCSQKTYYNTPEDVAGIAKSVAEINLFPNPADASINVAITGIGRSVIVDVKLFDMAGNSIQKSILTGSGGTINLGQLPAGVYLLSFSENGSLLGSKTFVKN